MSNLQDLIQQGRFVMADAPDRLRVFELVNGKLNTNDIAKQTNRHVNNVRRDLTILADAGLLQPKQDNGTALKKDGFPVFEKVPLARTIPLRYFYGPVSFTADTTTKLQISSKKPSRKHKAGSLVFPGEAEILDLARKGENQTCEFKAQGTDPRKITKEICAMLNTQHGGIILYGVDDDGNIEGSDLSLQKLDQPLQNSVRNSISPSATIQLRTVQVLGSPVIVILVPPWNRKDVYQFDEKVLVRKGTNAFAAKPDELRKLHSGVVVI